MSAAELDQRLDADYAGTSASELALRIGGPVRFARQRPDKEVGGVLQRALLRRQRDEKAHSNSPIAISKHISAFICIINVRLKSVNRNATFFCYFSSPTLSVLPHPAILDANAHDADGHVAVH